MVPSRGMMRVLAVGRKRCSLCSGNTGDDLYSPHDRSDGAAAGATVVASPSLEGLVGVVRSEPAGIRYQVSVRYWCRYQVSVRYRCRYQVSERCRCFGLSDGPMGHVVGLSEPFVTAVRLTVRVTLVLRQRRRGRCHVWRCGVCTPHLELWYEE